MEGVVDSGTTTTLTDSERDEKNGSFIDGTLWVLSGGNAGAVAVVSGHGANKLTVPEQTNAFAEGDRYALATADFPYWKIRQGINSVLGAVLKSDDSLVFSAGDYFYTLPTLPSKVVAVKFVYDAGETEERDVPSAHWRTSDGELIFDYGFGTEDGNTIRLFYKDEHDSLVDADDVLDTSLPLLKVKWDAIVNVLQWGVRQYKNDASKMAEEFLQLALQKQAQYGKLQNDEMPKVRYKGAGWR